MYLHFLWISPIHLAVFTYLVYVQVGWPAFLATAFVILQIPHQMFLAKLFTKLRWVEFCLASCTSTCYFLLTNNFFIKFLRSYDLHVSMPVCLQMCDHHSCRLKSAVVTDKRIKVMNEVITGIRVIKMYAWEYAFKRVVTQLRRSSDAYPLLLPYIFEVVLHELLLGDTRHTTFGNTLKGEVPGLLFQSNPS